METKDAMVPDDDLREETVREEQDQLGDPGGDQNHDGSGGVEPKVRHERSRVKLQLRLYASKRAMSSMTIAGPNSASRMMRNAVDALRLSTPAAMAASPLQTRSASI